LRCGSGGSSFSYAQTPRIRAGRDFIRLDGVGSAENVSGWKAPPKVFLSEARRGSVCREAAGLMVIWPSW
jgi:hypothetical protein